ncbi:hypothetical protein [Actinoplanes sp. NPDC023714]|uniref:hypothetical protein n=1 Tax=Actinoplanes sp. NPDC023714 TaxID=3154322 RepID=UPI0033D78FA6
MTVRHVCTTALTLAAVTVTAGGCPEPEKKSNASDSYVCTVGTDSVAQTVSGHGVFIKVGETSTRTLAVTVDPRTRARTYTATLIYELGAGAGVNSMFSAQVGKWVGGLAPSAKAAIEGTAGVGFTYERGDSDDAEDVLGEKWPPDRWNRMIVTLGARATGQAQALGADLASKVSVGEDAKAFLTVFPDGGFSITRSGTATLEGKAPSWLLRRFGVKSDKVSADWRGRLAVAYELLFDAARRPIRLSTVVDTERDKKITQSTRVVNLRKKRSERAVRKAIGNVLKDPLLSAVTADRIFFRDSAKAKGLWKELDRAETTVSATYEVDTKVADYPLDMGQFGIAYRDVKISRKLVSSHIRSGGGEQRMSCTGRPEAPEPPAKTKKYRELPAARIPAPEPSPEPSITADPSPSGSLTPSPPDPSVEITPSEPLTTTEETTEAPLPTPGEI